MPTITRRDIHTMDFALPIVSEYQLAGVYGRGLNKGLWMRTSLDDSFRTGIVKFVVRSGEDIVGECSWLEDAVLIYNDA